MAVDIDSIINEFKKHSEGRKESEIGKTPRGKSVKSKFAAVEAERRDLEQKQRQLKSMYFSTQREQQAAFRAWQKEFEALQTKVADAGTAEAELFLADIDETLLDTLKRDDYFNLDALKRTDTYPKFTTKHDKPIPRPTLASVGPRPEMPQIPEPQGMGKWFGGKAKYQRALQEAEEAHKEHLGQWEKENAELPGRQLEQIQEHERKEKARQAALAADRRDYERKKAAFDAEIHAHNDAVDKFKADYKAGVESAVIDYMNLVFARSLYPMNVPLQITHEYIREFKEVRVQVTFPDPSALPKVKAYKYVKARQEIQDVPVTQKEARDRYLGLIQNLSLRILHEIWEADREKHIQTASLSGWVDHVDPATGQDTHTQVIAVAVDRKTFEGIDLRRVTPGESLKYLGAVVSKNPSEYVPIVDQYGVRGR